MNQQGRLTVREYHGRLQENLKRFIDARDALQNILNESYGASEELRSQEQDKVDNLELAGTGLESTKKADDLREAVDVLEAAKYRFEVLALELGQIRMRG